MKNLALISLCVIALLLSCKKDQENYPIIYPGPYFPVYPNSWWTYMLYQKNYLVYDSDIVFIDSVMEAHSVDPAYQLNKYVEKVVDSKDVYSGPCYVPFYDDMPVYYYDRLHWGYDSTIKWPILSEKIGFTFPKHSPDTSSGYPYEIMTVIEKYFNGTDSVLVLRGYWINSDHNENRIDIENYTKSIGLTSTYRIDTLNQDTIWWRKLIDYYVSFDSTSVDY